jgi:hypothetical protein
MTTSTATLVDFLRERLDEDEAVALAATPGPWSAQGGTQVMPPAPWKVDPWYKNAVADTQPGNRTNNVHIARHDPARVLATVAAHRAIVELHSPCDAWSYGDPATCPELVALATIYADHPSFDPAWVAS